MAASTLAAAPGSDAAVAIASAARVDGSAPMSLERGQGSATVRLTAKERELFSVLLGTCAHFQLKTVLRVAGGWVRDKCLSRESEDIDIAVDDCTGKEFAHKVRDYVNVVRAGTTTLLPLAQASSAEGETSSPWSSAGSGNDAAAAPEMSAVKAILANPDQSKHLATATFVLNGISLDVNNLRTETYSEDSRIPEIRPGTAEEDAHRRDATINALFYNINEDKVEDLTRMGLRDLEAGYIRTPLDPIKSFRDDPLRVLRLVRFATRYAFELDPAILDAARRPEVGEALRTKISRERVGVETHKIFRHRNSPLPAVTWLQDMGLAEATFGLEGVLGEQAAATATAALLATGDSSSSSWTALGWRTLSVLSDMERVFAADFEGLEPDAKASLRYAAYLIAAAEMQAKDGRTDTEAINVILRSALVLPKIVYQDAASCALLAKTVLLDSAQLKFAAPGTAPELAVQVGQLIRNRKQNWRFCVYLAAAVAVALGKMQAEEASALAAVFIADVRAFGLDDCWQWTPLFNGGELQKDFGIPKGPKLGEIMKKQMDWRLEAPGRGRDEIGVLIREALA